MLISEAISCQEVFCKKDVLKNFVNSQEISFLNKIAAWRMQIFWKHVFFRTRRNHCFSIFMDIHFLGKKLKHDGHNTSLFQTLTLLSMVHFKDQFKKRPNLKSYIHDSNDIKFLWKIVKYTCLLLFIPWKISNQVSNPSFKNMNSKQADGLPFPIKFWHQFH